MLDNLALFARDLLDFLCSFVFLLDNTNEGGMFAEYLILYGCRNLILWSLTRVNHISRVHLPESEVCRHFFKVFGFVHQVDCLIRNWVSIACKGQLDLVQFFLINSKNFCNQLVSEDLLKIDCLLTKFELAILKAWLKSVSKGSNDEAVQVSFVVSSNATGSTPVLSASLDHVNVTVISKAESVHPDVVSTSQTFLNDLFFFVLGIFLTVCQQEDSGLRLVF